VGDLLASLLSLSQQLPADITKLARLGPVNEPGCKMEDEKRSSPGGNSRTALGIPRFVEPMLLLQTDRLPEGTDWLYELKFDGYRALAIKINGQIKLRSRNDKDFNERFALIARALAEMPEDTIIDGEIVALDEDGRPSFNLLQNYGSAGARLAFYVFDLLAFDGRNLINEPLVQRRALLNEKVLPKLSHPILFSPDFNASLADLIESVKKQGLEGLVAKRRNSIYEPGQRSGKWQKMRVNRGQELVLGGYTPSSKNFDALVLGYFENGKLLYAARTRNGFTPAVREQLFRKMHNLEVETCPFANLPEKTPGRWGQGLTAAKMKECRWALCRIRHSAEHF
jgi:bifunctional non-homologous end joining protein LigD